MSIHILPTLTETERNSLEHNSNMRINIEGQLVPTSQIRKTCHQLGLNLKPIAITQIASPHQPTPPAAA